MYKLRRKAISLVAMGALGLGATAAMAGPAFAAGQSATGTENVSLTAGSLSVGTVGAPVTLTAGVGGGQAMGLGPSALYQDATGSGGGWNATLGVTPFTYSGAWAQQTGTTQALGTATVAYSGTADGVTYVVTVGSGASGSSTPYTWTSNDTGTGNQSGAGTATNGTAVALGNDGVQINFAAGTTYASGDVFVAKVGALPASALSLGASGTDVVTAQAGTQSAAPVEQNVGSTVAANGTAVKFVSAAQYTGMGSYVVQPGLVVSPDASAWAATYDATLTYSIVTGP